MPLEASTFCPEHTQTMRELGRFSATMQSLAAGIASLDNTISQAFKRINGHIDEGEKIGGSRDRIRNAETGIEIIKLAVEDRKKEIDKLRREVWRMAIIGGVMGGLVGHITPDFFKLLAAFLKIHLG